jgi:hypothetical protein
VRGILSALNSSNRPADRRDAALIALLFSAALRRSESASLDYDKAGIGDGYLQLKHKAVEVVLLRAKARTEVVTGKIPLAANPGLVAALERWIAVGSITPGGPLFCSIKKGGDACHTRGRLKDGGVNVVLKGRIARYLQDCGYTPEAAAKVPSALRRRSSLSGRLTDPNPVTHVAGFFVPHRLRPCFGESCYRTQIPQALLR